MLFLKCNYNAHLTCVHGTASILTQSSVPSLPAASPQYSGCRVFTLAPHHRIAGNSAQNLKMASAPVLSSSTSGVASCGPPPAFFAQGATSSSSAGDLAKVQTSSRDICCQGYVGQGAMPAGQYHECDFDWFEHARAVRHLVDAQQAEAMALRSGSLGTSRAETFAEQPSVHFQQQHDGRQQRHQVAMASAGACTNCDEHDYHRSSAIVTTAASPWLQSCAPANKSRDSGLGLASQSQSTSGLDTHETAIGKQKAGTFMYQSDTSFKVLNPESGSLTAAPSTSSAEAPHVVLASPPSSLHGATPSNCSNNKTKENSHVHGSSSGMAARDSCSNVRSTDNPPQGASGATYEGLRWEDFYRAHPSARFFKERRYLLLEFPDLLHCEHVAEIGCGCGSSILPVLKSNQAARATCTDISTTSLHQLREAAAAEGIASSRVTLFPADATDPDAAQAFEGVEADALLIMFTLSAVMPEQQHVMLLHAWRALRPGGRLMLRDHGLYDMVQLRIPAEQWIGPNLYKRGDGTIAYFFSTEELSQRAICAGFEVIECKYVTIINRNRKTGIELRRVFVHGVFKKLAA